MATLLQLSEQYRTQSKVLKKKIKEYEDSGELSPRLKRDVTMLTAMARDAAHTANVLKDYVKYRKRR